VAYHDELLQQSKELVHKNPNNPTQADLRRSVSSAYYALFHLLIFEACLNWSNDISRPGLTRMFDHGVMKKVSKKVTAASKMPYAREDPVVVDKLRSFAGLFVQLQEQRHEADYNIQDAWTLTQSLNEMLSANRAFVIWQEIRTAKVSQDYLVSLLIRPRD
jgi:uncharacterized protein (UPF0332 family)